MSAEILSALAPFLDRLQRRIQTDAKLRQEVQAFGKALVAWVEVAEPKPAVVHAPTPIIPLPPLAPIAPPATIAPAPTYGRRVEEPIPVATPAPVAPFHSHADEPAGWMPQEPTIIAGRCRVKGDAAKLVARRNAGLVDESQFLNGVAEARSHSDKWPKCSLWMLDMMSLSRAVPVWDDLAGGYQTAADAAEFLQIVTDPSAKPEPEQVLAALNLAAEAQSLLFSAVIDTGNSRPDADQIQLYVTVRELAAARGTYIHRYLRREDRVDPRTWPDLRKRIASAMEPFVAFQRKAGNTKKILANLKFKVKKALADGPQHYDEWPRVMELLDEAVGGGIAPSHPELREMLLPVIELLPEDVMVPVNVSAVVREIDKHLATSPTNGHATSSSSVDPALDGLRGRTLVVIGGRLREAARSEILRALGPGEVIWFDPERSMHDLEAAIANPNTAAVLFAVRWSGHDFPDVRRLCAVYGRRLVRLPGGYSPAAIAEQWKLQPESSFVMA